MTTKELLETIRKYPMLRVENRLLAGKIDVYSGATRVLEINTKKRFNLYIDFDRNETLRESEIADLLTAVTKYANTSISQRKNEKLYLLAFNNNTNREGVPTHLLMYQGSGQFSFTKRIDPLMGYDSDINQVPIKTVKELQEMASSNERIYFTEEQIEQAPGYVDYLLKIRIVDEGETNVE